MFQALDPYNKFVFISKGKKCNAGTLIYQYHDDLPQNFTIHEDGIDLDFYTNNGFVYLPTTANKSKVPLETPLPEVPPLPDTVLALLVRLYKSTVKNYS